MRISDWSSDVCPSDLPTKRYDRHLAEEGRDAGIDIVRAEQSKQDADRREPEDKQGAGYLERPAKIRPGMVGKTFAQSRIAVMHDVTARRSEEHTSELQSLMRNTYAVFFLKKKKTQILETTIHFYIH